MKKFFAIIIVLVVVLVVGLSFGKNMIAKSAIEKGVELVTGLQLRMGSLNIGIVNTLVGIRNLQLYNPEGFKDKVMLNMPEVFVDYDLPAVLKGIIHLNEVRIDLKEFIVVKNSDGKLNLDSLKVVKAQKEGKDPEEKEKGKAPDIKIDLLKLKIGKVIYKDYSKGSQPSVRAFNVNIDETHKNITNPYALVSLIVVKALARTAISNLTDFDLSGLEGTLGDTLSGAQKVATETVTKAKETVKQTTEAATKTVEDIVDKIKLPFGD